MLKLASTIRNIKDEPGRSARLVLKVSNFNKTPALLYFAMNPEFVYKVPSPNGDSYVLQVAVCLLLSWPLNMVVSPVYVPAT